MPLLYCYNSNVGYCNMGKSAAKNQRNARALSINQYITWVGGVGAALQYLVTGNILFIIFRFGVNCCSNWSTCYRDIVLKLLVRNTDEHRCIYA